MQTFSIAAQQFGPFNFGVDASNTAIVTFSYPDPHDASRMLVARFNRNGEHVMPAEPPRVVPEQVTSPVPDPTPMPLPPLPYVEDAPKFSTENRKTGEGTSRDLPT